MAIRKKLWTFGDSFTAGGGCRPGDEYFDKYYKEGCKLWPDHLGALLDLETANYGRSGASNDTILDIILYYCKSIKKGDTVVIGMTYPQRFDIEVTVDDTPFLIPVTYVWPFPEQDKYVNSLDQEKKETIINYQYHFMRSPLIRDRWVHRYIALQDILKEKGCHTVLWEVEREVKDIETIEKATSYKISDCHFSFQGHIDFAKRLYGGYCRPLI